MSLPTNSFSASVDLTDDTPARYHCDHDGQAISVKVGTGDSLYLRGTPAQIDTFAARLMVIAATERRRQIEASMTPLVTVVSDRFASTHGTTGDAA